MVQTFLKAKVKPDLENAKYGGYSSLFLAIQKGDTKMVELLIAAGAKVNSREGGSLRETPLIFAAKKRQWDIVKILLNAKAELNCQDTSHYTPIAFAEEANNSQMFITLLQAGADFDLGSLHRGVYGESSMIVFKNCAWKLFSIAEKGYKSSSELEEILKTLGKGLNGRFDTVYKGCTALHWAIKHQQIEVVIRLLEAGADINMPNDEGMTPRDLLQASTDFNKSIRELLAAKNIKVDLGSMPIILSRGLESASAGTVAGMALVDASVSKGTEIIEKDQMTVSI